MKKYRVTFEIHSFGGKMRDSIIVEAGTKKLAMVRAIAEINKNQNLNGMYKNVVSVEEVFS